MVKLKGVTWDHERGYAPLIATNKLFKEKYPNVDVQWDKRSLKDFGDYPVSILAEKYDMIILDHPFVPQAYKENILVNINEYLTPEEMKERADSSVGNSHNSYEFKGMFFGLAVDAAAQVAAYRSDVLDSLGLNVPKSLDDVFKLAQQLPSDKKIALTYHPTDIIDIFFNYCYQETGSAFFDIQNGVDVGQGARSIAWMRELLKIAHPMSIDANPIQVLEAMSTGDEIVYSPFIFGYVNYSRKDYRKNLISFNNAPCMKNAKGSTVLGGTGICVSNKSENKEMAMEYVKMVTSSEVQSGEYYYSGGQPADRTAWTSPEINADCDNFFTNTLETLDKAFTRPRLYHWNEFQEAGGEYLHQVIETSKKAEEIVCEFNEIFKKFCC